MRPPETDDVEIPTDVGRRLLRAVGAMPYGGIVHAPRFVELGAPGEVDLLDPHSLAAYLEALGAVLARVAEENEEKAGRLRELESDVAAVRRLFGTEVGS